MSAINLANEPLRILLVGGGGREHAIAWKLAQSPRVEHISAVPGNPGIDLEPKCKSLDHPVDDLALLGAIAKINRSNLVLIGPEYPLSLGLADFFMKMGIPVFGPTMQAARLETVRDWGKSFMMRHKIPTPEWKCFEQGEREAAADYLTTHTLPRVIKRRGLAAGKGSVIVRTFGEALATLTSMIGVDAVVVEEFVPGGETAEATLMYLVSPDWKAIPFGVAQDAKRAFDGDIHPNPNTGGMGAYSPLPDFSAHDEETVMQEILIPTLRGLEKEGIPYCGVLTLGIIRTPKGPKLLEYSVRFNDPEIQIVLPRLEDDFALLLTSVMASRPIPGKLRWDPNPCAGVVLAAPGYPDAPRDGRTIYGLKNPLTVADGKIFWAGVRETPEGYMTHGGRIVCCTKKGTTYANAVSGAYWQAGAILIEGGKHFRQSIGSQALALERTGLLSR